jgi:hypothetical protein
LSNISGDNNVSLGWNTLSGNTASSDNIAIGYGALYSGITGPNIAIGSEALYTNTTGYHNVAVGHKALYANTTGVQNNAFGYNALIANTTGVNNTAIGVNAGASITTGSNNTCIGANTGITGGTFSNSTAIGYGAVCTTSNQIMLGTSNDTVYVPNKLYFNKSQTYQTIGGVPIGCIMAFIGVTIPYGWLLCDGFAIPAADEYQTLKNLVGNDTPNLKAAFLRGTGSIVGHTGPALKATQDDSIQNHVHPNTLTDPGHKHNTAYNGSIQGGGSRDVISATADGSWSFGMNTAYTGIVINNVNNTNGTSETTVYNYGVNWIIKALM